MNLTEQQKIKEVVVRGLAIVGFFALLFSGLWGTIQVVKITPKIISSIAAVSTSLTSIFISNKEATTISNEQPEQADILKNEDKTATIKEIAGDREDNIFPITSVGISNPNQEPDLEVTILATGIITTDNIFTPTESMKSTEKGAVRFQIRNIGGKETGSWTFNVVLPTFPMHIFHSEIQKSLRPGDRVEYTLGFDQVNSGLTEAVITINADPTESIKEISENNNIRQKTIQIVDYTD